MLRKRLNKIFYTMKHRRAFRKTEKELLGSNTIQGMTHDLDKLLMLVFCPFLSLATIKHLHKTNARHHNARTRMDYIQKIIDYECCRYTKEDKQLTASEYVRSKDWKPEEAEIVYSALAFLGLDD